ncbi:MAG: SurA N-terminal domain-containing protein [Gammaproteobacteria bacterium]|jgi:peptidyl-prolyl cis-trans isomerase D
MLGYIRESVQGWIAWAIVILLIIPFALWGINEYFGSGGSATVAVVNGEEISQQAYQREYYMQRDRARQMLGEQFNVSMMDEQIKQKALDDIVNREVLTQTANDAGYRISDQFLAQTIQDFEAFQESGQFSNDLYKQQLSAQGESPATFEYRIRRAILSQQLYAGLNSTPVVTDYDVNYLLKLQEQTRDIGYMVLKADNYKQDLEVTEQAIKDYYDEHQERYMTPEKVSLKYIELDVANLAQDEKPSEEELKQFYDERANLYVTPEERRTRHILITLDPEASEEQIQEAKQKAQDIRKQLEEGADFAELAKKYSEDPGSAEQGGDLGFFGKGSLDPAYEEAMFALKKGEISEPVLSAFGYHIIKLDEIREQKSKSFEEVKPTLIEEYRKNIAQRRFFDLSEKLTNLTYEVPDTLQDAAGATGLEIKTTDLFPRSGGGKGITTNQKVVRAAFSDDVLGQGYNSEPIELGENHVVFIRVDQHQEQKVQPLEAVRDQIKTHIINDKARARAEETGTNIIEQLSKGEATPDAAAKIAGFEWKSAGELKRTDRSINAKIVEYAFKMDEPAEGESQYSGTALPSGDYAVIAVNKVTDGDISKIDESKRLTMKRNLAGIRGNAAFTNLLQGLKNRSSISIKEDNL